MSDGHTECQRQSDRALLQEYKRLSVELYEKTLKLRAALEKYGAHDSACFNIYHPNECVCGLNRVLEKTK